MNIKIQDNMYFFESDISDNPFSKSMKTFAIDKFFIDSLVEELIQVTSDVNTENIHSSYQYNNVVFSVLNKKQNVEYVSFLPKKSFYDLLSTIIAKKVKDLSNWYDPALCAKRVLANESAYLTPGFAEAMQYSKIYGS